MKGNSSAFARVSVGRPVTVVVCLMALMVIGAVSYSRIRVQAFPSPLGPSYLLTDQGRRLIQNVSKAYFKKLLALDP